MPSSSRQLPAPAPAPASSLAADDAPLGLYSAAHLIQNSCSVGLAHADALRRLTAAGEVDPVSPWTLLRGASGELRHGLWLLDGAGRSERRRRALSLWGEDMRNRQPAAARDGHRPPPVWWRPDRCAAPGRDPRPRRPARPGPADRIQEPPDPAHRRTGRGSGRRNGGTGAGHGARALNASRAQGRRWVGTVNSTAHPGADRRLSEGPLGEWRPRWSASGGFHSGAPVWWGSASRPGASKTPVSAAGPSSTVSHARSESRSPTRWSWSSRSPATCRNPQPATRNPQPATRIPPRLAGVSVTPTRGGHPAPPRVQRERSRGGDGEGHGRHHR